MPLNKVPLLPARAALATLAGTAIAIATSSAAAAAASQAEPASPTAAASHTERQNAPFTSEWALDVTAGAVSDYRYRGLSLSDSGPAAQARVTLSHRSGVYGDAYLSTIDEYGVDADGKGATLEATLTAGWAGATAGFDVDAGIAIYRYPGGRGVNYYEIPLQAGQTVGPLTWTLGAVYAPAGQSALGDESNRYVWGGLDLAPSQVPLTLKATLGYEKGAYASTGKTDWLLGATVPVGRFSVGVDYVDSDAGKAAVVGRVFVSF